MINIFTPLLCSLLPSLAVSIDANRLAEEAYDNLVAITTKADGSANPRHPCTEGYRQASEFVRQKMQEYGLTPMGDLDRTTFAQRVPDSVDETWCPAGLTNNVGMVEGTKYPDQYIVYLSKLDGPHNDNPQTFATRGTHESVSNPYDNGLAVSVGLAIAKELAKNPPLYSVLFLFDDWEEGAYHVGDNRFDGVPLCDSFVNSTWFQTFYENVRGNPPPDCKGTCTGRCNAGTFGAAYFVRHPTVPLTSIRMLFNIGPLGAPYGEDVNFLAYIGGDQTLYNKEGVDGLTLDEFLDDMLPPDTTSVRRIRAPRIALDRIGSSINNFQVRKYPDLCDPEVDGNCLPNQGVPSIWMVQPAFQKFHSGVGVTIPMDLFGTILDEGSFVDPAYFSNDNMENFNRDALPDMVEALFRLVENTANEESVSSLTYIPTKAELLDRRDVFNGVAAINEMYDYIPDHLPTASLAVWFAALAYITLEMQRLRDADFSDEDVQKDAFEYSQGIVGLFVSMDFFSDRYPSGEAYLDQSFEGDENTVESEPPPTEGTDTNVIGTIFSFLVNVFGGFVNFVSGIFPFSF